MKYTGLISLIIIIFSSFFLGCVEEPAGTTAATVAPTLTATATPAVVPATPTPTPTPVPRIPTVYRAFVDQDYGFKRVVEINNTPFEYQNLTLKIFVNDRIVWRNDANPDEKLTIVSEQNLWTNTSAILRWNYQEFNYTFTQPGTYDVYLKEYPRKRQKIIVNPIVNK